ncbi:MAG TPA: hypothetical protein VD994_21385 [Prosthecobacter sp.]|nr:hypothetical protein [Prosthecobacter sp.]
MSSHRTAQNPLFAFRLLLLLPGLLLLVSCRSPTREPATARKDPLSGSNTLAHVSVRTTGNNVKMTGTTVDGRPLKSQGRTTRQAVDNLGTAANASR